jgi:hypothetical protein
MNEEKQPIQYLNEKNQQRERDSGINKQKMEIL